MIPTSIYAPTVGSLFAGIGGIDLGFERAGFKTVWQVEIDPYCRKVLERHFPDAERFEDVRNVGKHCLREVDVIVGGFPCQDISVAGKGAGITGERSGLWSEFSRIIGELRPRYVLVENVAALLGRGSGRVLGDLAGLGYDSEWQVISAADVGAPHLRRRVWVVAYPNGDRCDVKGERQSRIKRTPFRSTISFGEQWKDCFGFEGLADAPRIFQGWQEQWPERERVGESSESGPHPDTDSNDEYRRSSDVQMGRLRSAEAIARSIHAARDQWLTEPNVGRVAHGVPSRVDRLKGLGNSVVPQIPELIARQIYPHLVPASHPRSRNNNSNPKREIDNGRHQASGAVDE